MGPEGNAAASTSSPVGKRSRDPEDEVYVDNLHSHKRYLSEIMASSLNGLTVGDSQSENLIDSPSRSESMSYLRDETSLQYSPMSEDSDDSRYFESFTNTCSSSSQPESVPTSPVSPYRSQKNGTFSYSSPSRPRGSENEGRFPSSPSDICHSADLRRAALLRSVQMRTQPLGGVPPQFEPTGQESGNNLEPEEQQPCSYMSIVESGLGGVPQFEPTGQESAQPLGGVPQFEPTGQESGNNLKPEEEASSYMSIVDSGDGEEKKSLVVKLKENEKPVGE